jgi:hypothetical protein
VPGEYAAAGRVTAEAYDADDLLRRPDGLIDDDYEAQLTDASRRAREAELLVAVDDGQVLGTVTWCPPTSPWRELATSPDRPCGVWLMTPFRDQSAQCCETRAFPWPLARSGVQVL